MASTSIQTVPSSFTSTFSKPQPEYDVFLSFRGEDTRYKFTDHLYHALDDKKIITFKDDKELQMGEPISQELLEAIEKSRIAVIIFSENYASSPWCLEELAKIIECRDRGILTVLPIFYHVEPTDVRHQKNTFAEAFARHEKRFKENPKKVQKWRAALTNVANLSGERLKDGVHEANFIQSIVEWLYSKLKEKRSNYIEDDLVGISSEDGLVGISSRVTEIVSYLDLESTDVRFIGICEKSGMGKTTLAQAVYDKILNKFEACSFLENVREESEAHGLKTLQEQLLCDIGKGGLRVKDVHKGMQVISDIPHNKKVLIVVDDVSEKSQIETLVGKRDLFGNGSRIIVTTEDKDLLEDKNLLASYEIKIVYEARGLDKVEALQLFSLNAFHKPHCENDFLEYCNNFVEYAQGIPLVLKVLGSYLCTRTKNEWESAQNQLRAIPHEKTTKKLRIAFDGLGADEKKLFLDIACFFKGEEKNRVADILESVYFPDINLKNLIDKSLITLVGGKKLWMHNLLQQMGWEIVSEESEEARERSRLWHCNDIFDVLKNNTGTKHIEGMLLRLPPDEEEELNAESFSKLNKLRLLKICKVRLSCLGYLSNELCLLEWHDYPLESLPNSFQPGELVELIMHRSCLQQLPIEFSKLGKLKLIDLSDSQNLTRTPDFTGFSNIERLNFQGCTRLHELHPSVGGLKRLILLNLKDCKCLKNLPYELNLESLKTLILSGCSRFKKFPRIGRNMSSLLELYLDGTVIEELPPTIRRLTGLTLLNLRDCKNLKSFLSDIQSLTSLEILTLSGCKCQPPKAGHLLGLSPIGSSIGATLNFLRLISFLFLSFLAWPYTYLRIPVCATIALSTYCFRNARHPEPEPINLLSNLFSKLSTLVSLDLSDCNLLALPDDHICFSSIKSLNLSKNNFIHLPDCISQLSKLKILFLDHCSKLKSLPHVPLSARFVSVQGCTSLENYSNQVVVWTSHVAGFTIITCLGLAEDEDGTVAEVSLLDIYLLWQRYVKDQIHQMEGFCHVLPQIEIPEWFKHQRLGSFGPIPLPSNLFSNKNWKGIALCVIFVVPARSNDVSLGEDTKYFHEFYCRLDISGDLIAFKVPKETYVGSFGLWLYISHARLRKNLDERSCITPLIGTNSPDLEIKMCGARILYKQDMGEFLQNLGQKIVGSPNDLRGELNSHSQLSRLYQVDWIRNHLSDYISPQNASPPRSFAYQNGPAIIAQLPADLHDYSRRPTPVTKLLPSNETIQGECTSQETIFSNQVIAAGTSKSSRQGSIYLGKISSSLECWLNHGPYLQDHYEGPGTFNQCLPQSEIPGWFKSENIARSSSVTIELPLNLYDNLEWMGFAFCAVFSFQKHPTSVPMKGSEFSFIIFCHLKTNLGCMNPLYSISEEDVKISLHQRGFLWLSFIPCWFLSPEEWSGCTKVEFSFVSDSSAVSALKCGVDLVYQQKLEFTRRMVQCITSYDGPFSGSDSSSGTYSIEKPTADWEAHRSNSDKKTTRKANSNSQLANSQASKQRQPIEMGAKQKRNSRPKLDRRDALKNVESDLSSIGGHRSRSLDLPPFFHNQKSFRIKGTDGEFDLICRSLGLSGIDDFSIPTADWEAHRTNLATRLRNNLASSTSTPTPRVKPAQPVKLDEVRVRVGSVTAGPSQGIKGARPPVLAPPPVAGRSVAVDYTSTWELLKSFAPLEDEVAAPNTTRLGGYAETTSSPSSSSASSEEEDKKQNEGPSESTSNRNENETENENENENENDIGIVRATNVIPVYSFSPRGKLKRSISSWQKGELLGSGSFGTVYEGYTEDGYFFAVKEVSLLDQGSQGKQNISYLEQEISLLKQFEHENIVQYLGTEKDESRIYIFLELVTKGSLASLYQKYRLRDSQVSAYTRQILNGLKYLHDKKVIHRDIKCSNILVDANGSVKLADFGLAKVTKLNDIKSCKGTPFWMAPEVVNLKNRFYGLAADIWSLGCTVLEMLTRQHPYSHLEGMQALFMIGKGKPPLVPDSLSRDARDFILKCLQVNPNDRPTATQLLDHPFVTRPQNSFGPASPRNSIHKSL